MILLDIFKFFGPFFPFRHEIFYIYKISLHTIKKKKKKNAFSNMNLCLADDCFITLTTNTFYLQINNKSIFIENS